MAALKILYFAWVREQVGMSEESVVLPVEIETAAQLINFLAAQSDRHALAFANPDKLRCAVDQVIMPLSSPLGSAKEVAFFPPVTGG